MNDKVYIRVHRVLNLSVLQNGLDSKLEVSGLKYVSCCGALAVQVYRTLRD